MMVNDSRPFTYLRLRGISAIILLLATWQLHIDAAGAAQKSVCQNLAPSPQLKKFVDKLPIMRTIPVSPKRIGIGAWKIKQKLHRDLPPTTLYAFGESYESASFPSPTLEATRHIAANVRWENHIPDKEHFLPVDRTIHWANPRTGVPIVVHLHGGEAPSAFDGHPDAWWTPQKEYGPTFETQNYTYPNDQRPTMLWYHDHVVGITRLNVIAGLTGLYMIRSREDKNLSEIFVPGKFEIPVVLLDLQFWPNGSINFPNVGGSPKAHPVWCPEYFGDTILVNGKVWPYLKVSPRWYRLRMLNSANARFFNLTFSNKGLKFIKIGTDGGYLETPQTVSSVLFSPAERLDVLVDFSGLKLGEVVYVNNSAPAPFPTSVAANNPPGTRSVMKFEVVECPSSSKKGFNKEKICPRNAEEAWDEIEKALSEAVTHGPLINYQKSLHRHLILQSFQDKKGVTIESTLGNCTWTQPAMELPHEGAVEVWEMINTTPDAHPIHLHLIQFHVLNTQPFDPVGYQNGSCKITIDFPHKGSCFKGPPRPPAIYQTGFKDTAIVWPGNVTRYGARFLTADGQPYPFNPSSGPGFVWHCHILDHEDNDMMRPYKVIR